MADARAFCRAVMHEYERQWSRAGGHAVRHPLRLKMERLQTWCETADDDAAFDARLKAAQQSEDPGTVLLACELDPLWERARAGQPLAFHVD
jgi:hypothetical protein